ncbi:hypothetical protein VP1G_02347 [Cytospora mali]|uniref:Phenol acid carboxylase n=1 Tax=Cytospora mali TaxID=578113 RepID=A0A194UTR8_CYTMA|nr:hypothetical protein VP1G_02347 [Valsa mali var. pyri (nom. inval.)]
MPLPQFITNTPLHPSFEEDIRNTHLLYDYNAQDANGNPEKWRYEMWFFSDTRIVYAIHGGPMNGRINYQQAQYQCIRPGELWQCSWLDFSKGHWEHAEEAHGDKRNPEDFERWRGLAKLGAQTDRLMLSEQADILQSFKGKGNLVPIEPDAVTL